jgi:hypothetical protein
MTPLWLKIFFSELIFSFLCVITTKAYVHNAYAKASIFEAAFATLLFYDKKITFEDERSREWKYGYPFNLAGTLLGMLLGMLISR